MIDRLKRWRRRGLAPWLMLTVVMSHRRWMTDGRRKDFIACLRAFGKARAARRHRDAVQPPSPAQPGAAGAAAVADDPRWRKWHVHNDLYAKAAVAAVQMFDEWVTPTDRAKAPAGWYEQAVRMMEDDPVAWYMAQGKDDPFGWHKGLS